MEQGFDEAPFLQRGVSRDLEEVGSVALMHANHNNDVETLIRMMVGSFLEKGLTGAGTWGGTGTGAPISRSQPRVLLLVREIRGRLFGRSRHQTLRPRW